MEDDDPENIHPILTNTYETLRMFFATGNDHRDLMLAYSSAVKECPRLPVTEDSLLNYCDLSGSCTSSTLRDGVRKKSAKAIKVIVKTYRTHKEEFLYIYAVTLLRKTRSWRAYPHSTSGTWTSSIHRCPPS